MNCLLAYLYNSIFALNINHCYFFCIWLEYYINRAKLVHTVTFIKFFEVNYKTNIKTYIFLSYNDSHFDEFFIMEWERNLKELAYVRIRVLKTRKLF